MVSSLSHSIINFALADGLQHVPQVSCDLNNLQPVHYPEFLQSKCKKKVVLFWLNLIMLIQGEPLCQSCGKQLKAPNADCSPSSSAHISPVTGPEVLKSIRKDVREREARYGLMRGAKGKTGDEKEEDVEGANKRLLRRALSYVLTGSFLPFLNVRKVYFV